MNPSNHTPIRRALLSVSDKTGLVELAKALAALNIELLSTGGSAAAIRAAGLQVKEVSELTGFPEIMDGRVKTLHPKVHGGLLGRRGTDDAVMAEHQIQAIDLLVVNLYPFEQVTADANCSLDDAIENIDIGGPAMLRAAAKNHAHVVVVVDPRDYPNVVDSLIAHGGTDLNLRRSLCAKAYAHTAQYDTRVAQYLSQRFADSAANTFPNKLLLDFSLLSTLRYGENPHQQGALYIERNAGNGIVATAQILAGKELSFNNLADADAALECVKQFTDQAACVIVKHANPCGVALADDLLTAYQRAYATDPTSAFGGIIAFNRELDAKTAQAILAQQFVEVVIAPSVSADAQAAFASKPNVRLLSTGAWQHAQKPTMDIRRISGGVLIQDGDSDQLTIADLKVVTKKAPTAAQLQDLLFAWRVAMFVKSNAIIYAKDLQTIGIGAGQMSRVISARIAGMKAEEARLAVTGSVMASDAFFPFRDGIDAAALAGIAAVIQPGGSMRDAEVIAAADDHGMAMVYTGRRHFKH